MDDDAQILRAIKEIHRLRNIIQEVNLWIVCGITNIASPEDLMQNADRIFEITEPEYKGSGKDA